MQHEPRPIGAPAWDLDDEYSSFDDPRFVKDLERAKALLAGLELSVSGLEPAFARAEDLDPAEETALLDLAEESLLAMDEVDVLLQNLRVFANCLASVDSGDVRAKEYRGILSALGAVDERIEGNLDLLLARASRSFVEAFLSRPATAAHRFRVSLLRKHRDHLLELSVESALSSVKSDGLHAWGRLYDAITGAARCRVPSPDGEREIGLAEAASLLRGHDRKLREASFRSATAVLQGYEESFAAILNAIAGWRLSEYRMRSRKAGYHFLDAALASNRLGRGSLDAMMSVVRDARGLGRRALFLQARLLGLPRLSCWDILAPCPAVATAESGQGAAGSASATYTFAEGLELVRAAYASVHPAMGDFVVEMRDRKWIEARVLPTKRPGAYCTRFRKSQTPRVFQSYSGSLTDVSTLAHELGHAYHSKVLAALPIPESRYPMNLAETASIFGETALGDWLAEEPGAGNDRLLEVGWGDAREAATFLLNVPARFDFETAFYEARAEKPLGPAAISSLMEKSWKDWYGDSLEEHDPGFWRSKLHFYMSELSFYNFPYIFGYLFSLGVYARRTALGKDFHEFYKALLMDTGRMESEELARKHLGVDLGRPDFWQSSIELIRGKLDRFEALVEKAGR